jgi:hypothetical protein
MKPKIALRGRLGFAHNRPLCASIIVRPPRKQPQIRNAGPATGLAGIRYPNAPCAVTPTRVHVRLWAILLIIAGLGLIVRAREAGFFENASKSVLSHPNCS